MAEDGNSSQTKADFKDFYSDQTKPWEREEGFLDSIEKI